MKIPNQQKVWDNIAEEWSKYRKDPQEKTLNFLKKQKGKVLDLGCGSGRNLTKIKNGKMWLVDFSKEMIKQAKENAKKKKISAEFKVANTTTLPFKDNFFDSAIFINTLHCIETKQAREKSLKELFRVLKPKSQALISVWSKNQERIKNKPKECYIPWTTPKGKVQRYTYIFEKEELENLLKKVGFKILDSKEDKNIIAIVQKPQ